MARCNSCFSIITKSDFKCYVCGDSLPGGPGKIQLFIRKLWMKSKPVDKHAHATDAILRRSDDLPAQH
jgi:hypothetical protein